MTKLLLNKGSLGCILVLLLLFGCSPTEPEDLHGCLDSQACNYNSNATIDNNSCWYPDDGCTCDDENLFDLVESEGYYCGDISVLQDIININSSLNGYKVNDLSFETDSDGRIYDLDLSEMGLTTLPESIGNLSHICILNLSGNQLSLIPNSMCYPFPSDNYPCENGQEGVFQLSFAENQLCDEYEVYGCIHWIYDCGEALDCIQYPHFGTQDQSNCCEGPNGEANWTQCDD